MGLLKRKTKSFLFVNESKKGKSFFPNCIGRLGHRKRQTKQQQTNKEKSRKK